MPNIVEITVRVKDEATRGLSNLHPALNLAKSSAIGLAGALAGSGGVGVAGALGAATVAIGAFAAVAKPELDKVTSYLGKTGKAAQTAWKQLSPAEQQLVPQIQGVEKAFSKLQERLAPVVDSVIGLGAKTAKDLMPSLGTLAKAGATVVKDFLGPLDKFAQTATFKNLISQLAQLAAQAGAVAGPAFVQLLKVFMQLFVQAGPAGIQILKQLFTALITLVQALTPGIVILAQWLAVTLKFINANHLLVPALIAVGIAVAVLVGPTGIGAIAIIITAVILIIGFLAKHWKQIMHDIAQWTSDAVNWIKAHWALLLAILTGPIGLAIAWIIHNWSKVTAFFKSAVGFIRSVWNVVYEVITAPVVRAYNFVMGIIHSIENAFGGIGSAIGGALHFLGFAHGGITGAAGGGPRGNLTMVGEHGRELVRLPPGSMVHSNPDTERMLAGGSSSGGVIRWEIVGGQGEFERFMATWIRRYVKVNGGGGPNSVQKAFGWSH